MKSKPRIIKVDKMIGTGITNSTLPSYLEVGQRHFEKEKPFVGSDLGRDNIIILPVDLLALTLPPNFIEGIESVEMVYRKKA